ncbi:MAG TPA: uroporphyrinogen-III C-methyltransferase [Methanotrichaceae archaeon]|nr:uroporphyrinogen-III C-methyltransferase [Methanotrichaceae archaeon]
MARGKGKVYLVGAGPGDPELMTLKAKRLLGEADVVLYDRLLSPKMLEGLGSDVQLIDVGKSAGRHKLTQEEINQLLIEKASEGHIVVRLKGGDPYMFGRGGEEALALLEKGLPVEVVPGVTSAIAAPELAGIPVTHRGIASSLTVVTGHEEPGKDSPLDWSALARLGGTLVVLMGVARLEENIAMLVSGGKSPGTPAAIVEKGGWPEQRLVTGTLENISARARDAGVTPPAILVVGEVVELSEQLGTKRMAIFRPEGQMAESAALARDYGFIPVCAPAISLVERPLPADLSDRIGRADCVVFTSANGVEMAMRNSSIRAGLQGKAVAAIGPKTSKALERFGLGPRTPDEFSSAGLEKMLKGQCRSVLLLRSAQGTQDLVTNLEASGLAVDEVQLYDVGSSGDKRLDDLIKKASGIDIFAFTSASTARLLFERARELGLEQSLTDALKAATVAVIGPPTAAELKKLGVHVDVMPEKYTFVAMLQKLRRVG